MLRRESSNLKDDFRAYMRSILVVGCSVRTCMASDIFRGASCVLVQPQLLTTTSQVLTLLDAFVLTTQTSKSHSQSVALQKPIRPHAGILRRITSLDAPGVISVSLHSTLAGRISCLPVTLAWHITVPPCTAPREQI